MLEYRASFSEINVGELIKIHASNGVKDFVFEVEIMSKRQYSLGRPVSHGVKFVFNEESKEDDYDEFIAFWAWKGLINSNGLWNMNLNYYPVYQVGQLHRI